MFFDKLPPRIPPGNDHISHRKEKEIHPQNPKSVLRRDMLVHKSVTSRFLTWTICLQVTSLCFFMTTTRVEPHPSHQRSCKSAGGNDGRKWSNKAKASCATPQKIQKGFLELDSYKQICWVPRQNDKPPQKRKF